MFGLGGQELLLIFLIVLIFFGAKRLPELARGLGKSINEFRRAQAGIEEEINKVTEIPKNDKDLIEKISQMSEEEKAKLAELLNSTKK
ncbi:MAG: twin-arginine translocase TatA/TatE family subunit [Candidatus Thermochlorobacter aerophilum]|jgi:sec-independent protein translocase protein TatA|uniref:Sec-independent protein translocase protein TatA n=1 Tax=Candidatus Thermochlorobacter aerophilus TaxID=1868324 RepID=A0A395M2C5_9BACT|nr:MAG: twin-arginine translocase TatA/TatE family subunit [Candidatus Thermochlorobacter aerophilum]